MTKNIKIEQVKCELNVVIFAVDLGGCNCNENVIDKGWYFIVATKWLIGRHARKMS